MSTFYSTASGGGGPGLQQLPEDSQPSKLPWGWHFRPTGAELIKILDKKVKRQRQDRSTFQPEDISDLIDSDVLREIDLSQVEPWEIKEIAETCTIRAAHADELNQYFYTQKEQKYRHGKRSNRATRLGFWKATGRDKPIYGRMSAMERYKRIIGYRKALVFYEGRAPNGNKTDWILHEYRLDVDPDSSAREEQWVACHMFIKERNVPPPEVADVSEVPEVDWTEQSVKEEPHFSSYTDYRATIQSDFSIYTAQQGQELNYPLAACVRDDLSLPRLVEDDNNHSSIHREILTDVGLPRLVDDENHHNSIHREIPVDVGVLALRPETGRHAPVSIRDQDRFIAEMLNSYAENPQQSIWPPLVEGPAISDNLWNVNSTYNMQ